MLCALAGWQLGRLRRCVAGTTLIDAWWWACGAVGATSIACAVRWHAAGEGLRFAMGDYVSAVMGLTPFVAVLGARRPTNRVWTPFVMLPMIVVLNWPVMSLVSARGWFGDLALETPTVTGFVLVAVMGCGNYFGTRLIVPGLAFGALLCALVLCHAGSAPAWWPPAEWVRLATGLVAVLGLKRAATVWSSLSPPADRFDRLWFDVLDRFGVVWARRLQERLNALARQEQWPGRLESHGWSWQQPLTNEQQNQVEHACRWLLRRFVESKWIDARLGTSSTDAAPMRIDS